MEKFPKINKRASPFIRKVRVSGHGNSNNDDTPDFVPDSNSSILGLSNEILFVSEFFLEGGQNSQNIRMKTCCPV